MVADSTKLFFEGDNSLIYLTSDKDTGKPILLKVMRKSHPTSDELSLFLNEYTITKSLPIKGLRKIIGRVTIDGKPALWMEYVEAQTFKQYFIEQTKSLSELLEVMSEVCGILGEIHQHNIIHKDINSNNILITPDKQVKIIDFGISTNISVKNNRLGNPESLEGTLAYISPEQTGRMNRMVDYRSDLYSLGVTFYEALTGMLPFESEDALELVHAHLALTAKPPYQLDKSIPRLLSDLVMKLMSKNAEDRYQSALGIKADIDKIKEALAKQKQPDFKLAAEDFSGKFQIPQKLYGREKELDLLLKSYDRTCLGSTELLLIEGYSGVGKTALVHEIHKPITEKRGYFIEGKFDQFQRNVPYFAWIQAFKDFTNQLLTEDADSLERWKTKILQAVGSNGSILIEVIPQMALIIGDQHEVLELGPSEASNRFNLVFQNFVNVISKKEHPLVIFIDDWQWADSASLSLLETLLDNKNQDYLLIITAYRGNEVTPSHPFMMTVEELAKQKLAIQTIQLGNLKTDDLQKLIADSLLVNKADTAELTELIYAKTQGNAYFVNQILQTLYEKSLLRFDLASRQWKWDIGQIQAMNITDNVVDLMTEKVKQLPEYTQNTLKYAACIGNRFSLSTLALVDDDETTTEDNLEIIKELIEPGLVEGLISPYGKEFKFAHDRVQQAVYSLTSDLESRRTHLKIGRLMVERVPEDEWENYLFEVVNQFNLALSLIEDPAEKVLISQINQEAGQKAKISAAYKPALNYFETAIQLCQESDWQTNYERMLNLYSEAAQVAFLRGDFDKMNQYVQTVIDNASVITDTVPVYDVKMQYHIAQGDQQKAIEVGLYVTHLLEVPLIDVQPQVEDIEGLINLQEMTDPFKIGAMQILDSVIAPAWTLNPQLFQRLCYTMVDLSVRFGDSPSSAVGYAFYGGLLCGQGDIENGYKFGKLAMQVVDKYNAKDIKSKVSNLYISTVMHWREPAKATIKPFLEAVQIGLETGDVEFACYNMVESSHYQFLTGAKLESLSKKYDDNRTLIKQLNQEFHLLYLSPWQQMLANLKGENENPLALQGDFFDEYQTLPLFEADNNVMLAFMSYQAKTILSYLLHQPDQAYQNALQAEKYKEGGIGMLYQPTHNFFYSLSLIAQCVQLTNKEAIANLLEIVNQNQEELQKWASHSPANAKHKFTLVLAELLNLSGEHSEAANYYDLAIDGAKEARIIYEEALANELAGAFYIQIGKPKYAKVYLTEAYSLYQTWGCSIKLKDMASRYELYLDKITPTAFQARSTVIAGNTSNTNLDMNTILKASQTLSGEVVWSSLLEKMMQIIIENAGAERGVLLMEDNHRWLIYTEGKVNQPVKLFDEGIPYEEAGGNSDNPLIPISIINFVLRTRDNVVLDEATEDARFGKGAYIRRMKSKSVICTPLTYKNKLLGLLYLENNLIRGAFNQERLNVLNMLTSQIAISIDNAMLYENLEEKVRERTQEVSAQKEIIEKKNQDITSSITYAKRIQEAMLPQRELINNYLTDYFIYFRPRDIVSGDFYWFLEQDGKLFFAAVDCTGHGVPGAFMSMIGSQILHDIIGRREIIDPGTVLAELHKGVNFALKQDETENRDGMDLSFCVIDIAARQLQFAGAKNGLFVIHQNQLSEVGADKLPIGGKAFKEKERLFTTQTIQFTSPTYFYMTSDGYVDQFGGPQGLKFMKKKFKELLIEIHQKPFPEQENILKNTMEAWMRGHKQTDDMLVVGFKL